MQWSGIFYVSHTNCSPIFSSTASEPLQMTGLSDIADILNDLIEGGVAASDLGLTQKQAQAISRYDMLAQQVEKQMYLHDQDYN